MNAPRLTILDVSKSFGPTIALQRVHFALQAGEVVALMGENGAGKSTLLKIISGDYKPDTGTVMIDGQPVTFRSTHDARERGIRVIAQEPEIIRDVSVAENIYVGRLPNTRRAFSPSRVRDMAREALIRFGFDTELDPTVKGSELSPAQRQLVEIMRALVDDPVVIAFDEPTSSLTARETDNLFALIRRLRDRGVAIVYVSHRMHEIFELANRVVVLRDGVQVGDHPIDELNETQLVKLMVGRELSSESPRRRPISLGQVMLQVEGLSNSFVSDITFSVRAGEVVALSGLIGAGRSELARTIVGDLPHTAGALTVAGKQLKEATPKSAVTAGVGFAPEERKSQALLMQRTIRDNITLAVLRSLTRLRFVQRPKERSLATDLFQRLGVRARSIEQLVSELSGGNQQKVVLARWLARRPSVLILDEPTRGVDVGAKAEIYALIDELASEGVAILFVSSEMAEVLALADRVLVMREGRLVGELSRDQCTEERLLALALPQSAASS